MNETEQLKTVWQVLESRDRAVFKARQERDRVIAEETKRYDELAQTTGEIQAQLIKELRETQQKSAEAHEGWYETQRKLAKEQEKSVETENKLRAEIQEVTVKLQLSQTKQESLQQIIKQKEGQIEDIKAQLNNSEEDRRVLWQRIDQLQEQVNERQGIIEGMESSKFWQLRQGFLRLKKSLGLKAED